MVEPDSGEVLVGGADVRGQDPVLLRRRTGYVIQGIGLFPHLSVAENMATVPRLLGWDKARVARRVGELLELVRLQPSFASRMPRELSGGEAQRVGFARALAADPPVLLMDEPFGALDALTREALQGEFARIQAELRKTVVFVTHDVAEAVRLADRILILKSGTLLRDAPPAELLSAPGVPFVAEFLGPRFGLELLARERALGSAVFGGPALPGTPLPPGASLRDALARMVAERRTELPIASARGETGRISIADIAAPARAAPAEAPPARG
jgi:osmoprotectant transport system ATP-binding protein